MPPQDTLVSTARRRKFHRNRALAAAAAICLPGLVSASPARASDPDALAPLAEPARDSVITRSLDLLHRGAYSAADSVLRGLPDAPARGYFRGLVLAGLFHDLGDTAALNEAEREWERLDRAGDDGRSPLARDPNYGIYRGLSELQLSYVASLRRESLRAARLGRRAAKRLEAYRGVAEAEAALALYDYYKAELLKGIDWLPFVRADRAGPLRRLEAAAPRSRYLAEPLSASLLWIYYDAGRYAEGIAAIRVYLSRYPGDRLWRQMLADFHFRGAASGAGSLDSALAIHLALAAEYRTLADAGRHPSRLPLGYLCSVGNLAKIYAARKQGGDLAGQLEIWSSPRYAGLSKWLPASLVREVEALRKENLRPK